MSTELAIIIPEELNPIVISSGLEKANFHAATFAPYMIKVNELSEKLATINQIDPTPLDMKLARDCKLALVKNRTATGKQKDAAKAPVKEKMKIWVESIAIPASPVENNIAKEITNKFVAFKTWATAQIEKI